MIQFIFSALLCCYFPICFSQRTFPTGLKHPYGLPVMSSVPNQELFKDRSNIYFNDEFYIIDGKKVDGSPFLYHDWMKGEITTVDGRNFSDFRVKYNAFQQSVYFHNGTDSLEVNDPVKQFTLIVQNGDTNSVYTFINASQIRQEKKPMYYELLLDHPTYQVLRYNRKYVSEASKSLPVAEGRKIFALEMSYYLYNKTSNKIIRIKANGTNIAEALGITPDQVKELKLDSYDFSGETDILRFFQLYFSRPLN